MIAEVLVHKYLLLGKERDLGDILSEDDLRQIDEPILRALENQKIIRILQNTNSEVIADLEEHIEELENSEVVADLEERIEKLEIEVFASVGEK